MGREDRLFPFSLQQYFGYLLCPGCFFLGLINSLKLCLEVIFRHLQNCLFGFFSLSLGSWDLKMVTVRSLMFAVLSGRDR